MHPREILRNMNYDRRNNFTFGLGTIGRDMLYSLISMYLIFYLTDILRLSDATMWWITIIIMLARIFDAVNDPVMGVIVDNTRTRWGKFKPWIAVGALTSGVLTLLLFTDFGLRGNSFTSVFAVLYLLWGISWTMNDIAFWGMLPALSTSQADREKIGSFARICANIGLFAVVVGVIPVTEALTETTGSATRGWFLFAAAIVVILILGQSITLFGVKEHKGMFKKESTTGLKDLFRAIFRNDQLMVTTIAMVLFMVGYVTTTSFGLYFFKYAYGDEGMYSIFAGVLGVSQILALALFPAVSRRVSRKKMYTWATIVVLAGYVLFFFSPMNMIFIGIAGILLFSGQAFIQILMLMFLTDTVEYGQWKLGKRNEAVTFALQPFINKMGGALATGIVGAVVILSGINEATSAADVTTAGLLQMRFAMLGVPPLLILAGYLVYRRWFKIDEEFFSGILEDLKVRGDISED